MRDGRPPCWNACSARLLEQAAAGGHDVVIGWRAPAMPTPELALLDCHHGNTFYVLTTELATAE